MTQAFATPEMQATHADRPSAKRMLPIRVIPYMVGGKQGQALEHTMLVPAGRTTNNLHVRQKKIGHGQFEDVYSGTSEELAPHKLINVYPITPAQAGLYSEPMEVFAADVKLIMDAFWGEEAKVDGLQAQIDALTTENVLKDREIEKLTNQLAQMKQANGKKNTSKE